MSLLSRIAVEAARGFGILARTGSPTDVPASYLAVAGGGSGGSVPSSSGSGGGAGAGGFLTSTLTLSTLNTYSIAVGAGGSAVANLNGVAGSNSVISGTGLTTVTAIGGGGGGLAGGVSASTGGNGGSGGGGGFSTASSTAGTGTSGQGSNGGIGQSGFPYGGGGGGGASATGGNAGTNGGTGGAGTSSSISGSSVTYAGGGGGGSNNPGGAGGAGGGGAGGTANVNGTAGTANTGGGGGGGGNATGTTLGGAGGSGVVIISYTSATPKFVGGTLTTSGGNQIHTFTSSGTLSPLTPVTASYLVVAGGGGTSLDRNGGGGAGGLLTSSTTLYSGATYVVTVGAGGAGGSGTANATSAQDGSNSVISGTGLTTLTATGGGGGNGAGAAGRNGGSGGGGGGNGSTFTNGGTGTSGQGTNGGNGASVAFGGSGGGGGGATSAGSNAASGSVGGAGGAGTASSISGTSITYAGGGGGGASTTGGTGGAGGGGNGAGGSPSIQLAGVPGTQNTGGGAGGGSNYTSSAVTQSSGGSGTVIISYAGSQVFNGGLVTSSGGNTIHTFNATGALTPVTNNLTNSLRFRASASAYLNRTLGTPTNNKIFTYSVWVKRGALGADYALLSPASTGTGYTTFRFESDNTINFQEFTGSAYNYQLDTTQVFRDPSAWYHLVVAVDTTQATAANRIKLYVNGNQVTAFATATYPTQNLNPFFNSAVVHRIGANNYTGNVEQPFDGYMDDINFIDGQALEPYYFGNNDANNVWKPIKYTGMYGTNGYYLTFADTTSTTTLGYDSSGNNNNWTANNISLTAGVTYDAMLDVPTNTSATVANYCVMNSAAPYGSSLTLSQANLKITCNGAYWAATPATFGVSSGKWYWEVQITNLVNNSMLGITKETDTGATTGQNVYPGISANSYGYIAGGQKFNNASSSSYGASYTTNDIIGIALDMDAGTLTYYKNNTSQGTAFSSLSGTYLPSIGVNDTNTAVSVNFGQRPFSYTPPTGFVALNTFNLPTPTILQGNKYMDATLYTGTGTSQVIVNQALFKPDLVWTKSRNAAYNNKLWDSVRGVTKTIDSNSTAAESTVSNGLTAFNNNGMTLGGDAGTNTSSTTYVGWQWQAGQGSTSSNTSGSITSTVSVNATAGFSVVTYTGTGSVATVGHGLGVAPKWIVVKGRGNVDNWPVYQASANASPATGHLLLNTNGAFTSTSTTWNNTAPTSTVFTVGTDTRINQNTIGYVAYCWAEIAGFSKFGSYVGNGSADGTFVYTGFRPKYVLLKSTGVENWFVFDSSRNTYNVTTARLYPSLSNAEDTNLNTLDLLSNGFKFRDTNVAWNGSGTTYIYACFAENPFKNANAR
jgi:hypothetical protein